MTENPEGWTQLRSGMWARDEDLERWAANPAPTMLRVYHEPREFTPTALGERIRAEAPVSLWHLLKDCPRDENGRIQLGTFGPAKDDGGTML